MRVHPLGMGLPLECSCCFLRVLLGQTVSGGRLSGGAAAGNCAGPGPLLVLLHSVSHGQSPAVRGFPALPGCGQRRGAQAGVGAIGEAAAHLEVELASLPSFPMELSCSGRCQQQVGEVPDSVLVHTCAHWCSCGPPISSAEMRPCTLCNGVVALRRGAERCSGSIYPFASFSRNSPGLYVPSEPSLLVEAVLSVVATVPERLSPTRHRNGVGMGPGEGSTMAQMKNCSESCSELFPGPSRQDGVTTVGIFRGQLPAMQEKESSRQAGELSDASPVLHPCPAFYFLGLLALRSFHILCASLPVAASKDFIFPLTFFMASLITAQQLRGGVGGSTLCNAAGVVGVWGIGFFGEVFVTSEGKPTVPPAARVIAVIHLGALPARRWSSVLSAVLQGN